MNYNSALKTATANGDLSSGLELLEKIPEASWDEETAVLAASIYHALDDLPHMFAAIRKGLLFNHQNYELYLLLGNYYEHFNADQAYLCYENAQYYCKDPDDAEVIFQFQENLLQQFPVEVHPVSIVMLSYNLKDITIPCIESIRSTLPPASYELVCVDNASSDGIREWLMSQEDIKLICNETNIGFPAGCNVGIKAASPENDILLLNNDTVLPPNAVFWLRMGLYASPKTGASGSICNIDSADQEFIGNEYSLKECMAYGVRHNIPMENPYESKIYLTGFALLIKRRALDTVGLLDIRFSPGTFEDNDYGVRLQAAGFQCLLCHNSFIYHYGSGNGANRDGWCKIGHRNNALFIEKHGYDLLYHTQPKTELINMITHTSGDTFSVLEIGCGCGAALSRIQYLYPHSDVHGIELAPSLARLGSNNHDIICGNIEDEQLPYPRGQFDYIILGNVFLHLHDPQKTLSYLSGFLKPSGKFLCSIPNMMHCSILFPLLMGDFKYRRHGTLNRKHIHFYTLGSIISMFNICNLKIEKSYSISPTLSADDSNLLDQLQMISGIAAKEQFLTQKYLFCAEKCE